MERRWLSVGIRPAHGGMDTSGPKTVALRETMDVVLKERKGGGESGEGGRVERNLISVRKIFLFLRE